MTFEHIEVPDSGDRIQYDSEAGTFSQVESPIIPVVTGDGVGGAVVPAARRVLDAAAEEMGRTVHWMNVFAGGEAETLYNEPVPQETVTAFERYRVGLVGPLSTRSEQRLRTTLWERLDLEAEIGPISHLTWTPSSVTTRDEVDLVCFRDITEDAAAGLEFDANSVDVDRIRTFIDTELDRPGIDTGPAGISIRPITRTGTERLVERAVEFALDRDRNRVTIVHQSDQLPATDGGFRTWALEYLDAEYADATISEDVFRSEYETYPDDELVVDARYTDDVYRQLITDPGDLDVLVAPALAGAYLFTLGSEVVGGAGVTPSAAVSDGLFLAGPQHGADPDVGDEDETNPIATIRAGCLLFEELGWGDAAGVVRDAVEATLADGIVTRDLACRTERCTVVTTQTFTTQVVEHIRTPREQDMSGGVQTTAEERAGIKSMIAGLYNVLFEDQIVPMDIHLNQLRCEDEEADVYLPEVGINFRYWRLWSVERRLEVLIHELAHVENYDDDHEPSFYDRFVELTEIAEDWQAELEVVFDKQIDFELVKRHIAESVHEETIEPDIESVEERQQALRRAFGLPEDGYY